MQTLKKLLITTSIALTAFLCHVHELKAQTPQTINYHAVARDTSGSPIANQTIDVEFTIIDSVLSTSIYIETWSGVVTNRFGLFALQIGRGSTTDSFEAIDWSTGGKYLKVNIDGVDMGNPTELVSVPYAIYADRANFADSAGDTLVIDSTSLVGSEYILYTNQGNDTTDLNALNSSSLDSIKIVGLNNDTLRLYQGQTTLDLDVSSFIADNDPANETIDTIVFGTGPLKALGILKAGDTHAVSLRALSDTIVFSGF